MDSQYISIFDPIPWQWLGITFFQAFIIFWLVLLGLRMVGRRTFSEMGAQEIILLLLISEATDLGIAHAQAGFWGSVASILALLSVVYVVNRVPSLHALMDCKPIQIMRHGKLNETVLKNYQIEKQELEMVARRYGVRLSAFESMTLEGDGQITGVIKKSIARNVLP